MLGPLAAIPIAVLVTAKWIRIPICRSLLSHEPRLAATRGGLRCHGRSFRRQCLLDDARPQPTIHLACGVSWAVSRCVTEIMKLAGRNPKSNTSAPADHGAGGRKPSECSRMTACGSSSMTRACTTPSLESSRHPPLFQSRWFAILMTLPSGARTKNRRTPHGSVVIGCTIS